MRRHIMQGAHLRLMLKVASGQPIKSEAFDFGGAEFAPWVLEATR
jgi:arabinonate dehydratase